MRTTTPNTLSVALSDIITFAKHLPFHATSQYPSRTNYHTRSSKTVNNSASWPSYHPLISVTQTPPLSNVLIDLNPITDSYNSQCSLTEALQYLSHTLLSNTINDSLDNPKPTVLAQVWIYIRETLICPCSTMRLTKKYIPPVCR